MEQNKQYFFDFYEEPLVCRCAGTCSRCKSSSEISSPIFNQKQYFFDFYEEPLVCRCAGTCSRCNSKSDNISQQTNSLIPIKSESDQNNDWQVVKSKKNKKK